MRTARKKEDRSPGGTARLVGLSDGLFATVLTLLVLDLRIPEAVGAAAAGSFQKWIGPHLFSYLLTFLVSGTYWMAHHRDFDHIVRQDRTVLSYNLLFLLFIGLLPFTTATIGQTDFSGGSFPFYWAMYSVNIACAGVTLTVTWLYALRHGLVEKTIPRGESRRIIARQVLIPVVFLVSIATEAAAPKAFLGPYTLLAMAPGLLLVDRLFHVERTPQPLGVGRQLTELLWRAGTVLPWLLIIGLAWYVAA